MKKKQVESDSEEDQLQAEDSDASGVEAEEEEDLQEEDTEDELDLGASSTESDEDSDEESPEDEAPKSKEEQINEKIHAKYEQLKGTRLYVCFPQKLPLDVEEFNAKVKALHPLVVKSTKPRQKHARFCLVNFGSPENRDKAYEDIKSSIQNDPKFKGLFVSLPKTESDDFVNELVTKKQLSQEKKRTKSRMKRATKLLKKKGTFTTSIVITNLPKTSSVAQVRQLFADAVDIQIRPGKGKFREFSAATVTLPTSHDARLAIKKKLSLSGTELILRFNTANKRKPKDKLKQKADKGKSPQKKQKQKEKDTKKAETEKGDSPKKKKANPKRKADGGDIKKINTPKKMKKLTAE
ncbi:nucleolin [Drosophila bipectinata]|uniref:nucleolin n=1 Tax=Drosophila bipectinata TaxID=42026 RepID=UPI001C891F21|nr:nucleolin [Drosophila bipectinata]